MIKILLASLIICFLMWVIFITDQDSFLIIGFAGFVILIRLEMQWQINKIKRSCSERGE